MVKYDIECIGVTRNLTNKHMNGIAAIISGYKYKDGKIVRLVVKDALKENTHSFAVSPEKMKMKDEFNYFEKRDWYRKGVWIG